MEAYRTMAVMWNPTFDWDNDRWRDQAACQQTEAELFFPAGSTGLAADQIKAAKAVCQSCPVQHPCLQFALETNQEAGIWGGKDEDERRKLRRVWRAGRRQPKRSLTI
ncbi:WhiB family transcriptional regulator [soil metagenome]